jgi:transposase
VIVPAQHVRIVVATKPVDFRRGHDGLAATVQRELGLDPHSGVIGVAARFVQNCTLRPALWSRALN